MRDSSCCFSGSRAREINLVWLIKDTVVIFPIHFDLKNTVLARAFYCLYLLVLPSRLNILAEFRAGHKTQDVPCEIYRDTKKTGDN